MSVGSTVAGGPLVLALPIAAAAGVVSFLSPCVLPLVPGYLSYITGLSGQEINGQHRGRVLAGTLLFVAGFSAVFMIAGVAVGATGAFLIEHTATLQRVTGAVTVLLGLQFAGLLPGMSREWRLHRRPATGLAGAPLLGAMFGLGWTPCIGPTLGVVLTLAVTEGSAARGAWLAGAYCIGLGLPFVAAGLAYRRALGAFTAVRAHSQWVLRAGGGMLVVVGLLLVTGTWGELIVELQRWSTRYTPTL